MASSEARQKTTEERTAGECPGCFGGGAVGVRWIQKNGDFSNSQGWRKVGLFIGFWYPHGFRNEPFLSEHPKKSLQKLALNWAETHFDGQGEHAGCHHEWLDVRTSRVTNLQCFYLDHVGWCLVMWQHINIKMKIVRSSVCEKTIWSYHGHPPFKLNEICSSSNSAWGPGPMRPNLHQASLSLPKQGRNPKIIHNMDENDIIEHNGM